MLEKTLITGGTGLVGSAINASNKLSSKDLNLLDPQKTLEMFEDLQPV